MDINKNKKWLLFLGCWFLQIGFPSCKKCSFGDCCGPFETIFYDISHCGIQTNHADNGNHHRDSFIFSKDYQLDLLIVLGEEKCALINENRLSFSSGNLYACSPPDPKFLQFLDSILGIEVYDLIGLNSSSDTGNIANRFEMQSFSAFRDTAKRELSELKTSNFNQIPFSSQSYPFSLTLKELPATTRWHQFRILVHLSDNRTMEHLTDRVFLDL